MKKFAFATLSDANKEFVAKIHRIDFQERVFIGFANSVGFFSSVLCATRTCNLNT